MSNYQYNIDSRVLATKLIRTVPTFFLIAALEACAANPVSIPTQKTQNENKKPETPTLVTSSIHEVA